MVPRMFEKLEQLLGVDSHVSTNYEKPSNINGNLFMISEKLSRAEACVNGGLQQTGSGLVNRQMVLR